VVRLTLDLEIQRRLEQVIAPGEGDSILVIMEGKAVRAFQCIGGMAQPDPDFFIRMLVQEKATIGNPENRFPESPDSTARLVDSAAYHGYRTMQDWQWMIVSGAEWKCLDLIDKN
jgi:hypothetical protein